MNHISRDINHSTTYSRKDVTIYELLDRVIITLLIMSVSVSTFLLTYIPSLNF
jgi:hypothetical protein